MKTLFGALFFLLLLKAACAADTGTLIQQLGSADEKERSAAFAELQKLGAAAEQPLSLALQSGKLPEPAAVQVSRLLGTLLVARSPLKPIDHSALIAFGADKEKRVAGNPDVLLDTNSKVIALNGEFVLEAGMLEYLAVSKGPNAKTHESVLQLIPRPRDICYALLACNYTFVEELDKNGQVNLPKDAGIMLSVEFEWAPPGADPQADPASAKKLVRVPIEYFAYNEQTLKTMKRAPFAFTGSQFERDRNGKLVFVADLEGSVVALKFDHFALMNTPLDMRLVNPYHAAGYSVNIGVIPKRLTKCWLVIEPWTGTGLTAEELRDTGVDRGPVAEPPAPKPPSKTEMELGH